MAGVRIAEGVGRGVNNPNRPLVADDKALPGVQSGVFKPAKGDCRPAASVRLLGLALVVHSGLVKVYSPLDPTSSLRVTRKFCLISSAVNLRNFICIEEVISALYDVLESARRTSSCLPLFIQRGKPRLTLVYKFLDRHRS